MTRSLKTLMTAIIVIKCPFYPLSPFQHRQSDLIKTQVRSWNSLVYNLRTCLLAQSENQSLCLIGILSSPNHFSFLITLHSLCFIHTGPLVIHQKCQAYSTYISGSLPWLLLLPAVFFLQLPAGSFTPLHVFIQLLQASSFLDIQYKIEPSPSLSYPPSLPFIYLSTYNYLIYSIIFSFISFIP